MSKERTNTTDILRIPFKEMKEMFCNILIKHGFGRVKAETCADIFAENSLDGIYTHGVNRFARFIEYVNRGYINVSAEPTLTNRTGAIEQWNGNLGPGPLNALFCTERAIKVSKKNGVGCVALANTNHWMRAGYYGWKAARKGYVFIGWTNTIKNMPAWGAVDPKLGNNPLVLAVPFGKEAIVLDMAMSQFSYGAVEMHAMRKEKLKSNGGYNIRGVLTTDPVEIIKSKRLLPMGLWKGAGLALLLDVLAAVLSGGTPTATISKRKAEYGVSQVFITIDISKLNNFNSVADILYAIIQDYSTSIPEPGKSKILYPGERVLAARKENTQSGIPVDRIIWKNIQSLL